LHFYFAHCYRWDLIMFRNVLTVCFFLSSAAARSPQDRPPEALARSLLNVTNYFSNYAGDKQPDPAAVANGKILPGLGGSLPFLRSGKAICDVKAESREGSSSKYVHMVVGNLADAEMLGSYAYVMRVDWDATGELDPMAKVFMDSWDQKLNGKLKPALDAIPDAVASKEESIANQGRTKNMLGKAKIAPGLTGTRVIFTGGTSENEEECPNGGVYFTYMNDAYDRVLEEAGQTQEQDVRNLVLAPLGASKSYNPNWLIDKDVLVFYTGNKMTHHLMTSSTSVNDIYVVLPDEPANILAMCKYCQYRSLTPIHDLGNGICTVARQQSGASIVSMLAALLAAASW